MQMYGKYIFGILQGGIFKRRVVVLWNQVDLALFFWIGLDLDCFVLF